MTGHTGVAARAVAAVQSGDVAALRVALAEQPNLACSPIGADCAGRTLLHVLTDWPGHRSNAAETVAVLVAAGADVDAAFVGEHAETPLHWAASCDDIACIDALLDAGADIEAQGGSVGDGSGTPLFDATVFGQWAAAGRLLERGAATGGWEEAALGLIGRLSARLAKPSERDEVTAWFRGACHGGQLVSAELLLDAGADRDWVADWDGLTPLDAALRAAGQGVTGAEAVVTWLRGQGARSAAPS